MTSKSGSKSPSGRKSKSPSGRKKSPGSKSPSKSRSKSPSQKKVNAMFHTIMTKTNPKPFPNPDIENVIKNMEKNGKFDRLVAELKNIKNQSKNQEDQEGKYMEKIVSFIIKETGSDKTVGGGNHERSNSDRRNWQHAVPQGFEEEYGPANPYAVSIIIAGAAAIIFYNPLASSIVITGSILAIAGLRRRGGQGSSTKTRRRR